MLNGISFLIIVLIAMSTFAFKDFGLFSKGSKGAGKGGGGGGGSLMMMAGDAWSSPTDDGDGDSQCKYNRKIIST